MAGWVGRVGVGEGRAHCVPMRSQISSSVPSLAGSCESAYANEEAGQAGRPEHTLHQAGAGGRPELDRCRGVSRLEGVQAEASRRLRAAWDVHLPP